MNSYLWIIEHRDTDEDTTVMAVATDHKELRRVIQTFSMDHEASETGWYAAYQMKVNDAGPVTKLPRLHFYDLNGVRYTHQQDARNATGRRAATPT